MISEQQKRKRRKDPLLDEIPDGPTPLDTRTRREHAPE